MSSPPRTSVRVCGGLINFGKYPTSVNENAGFCLAKAGGGARLLTHSMIAGTNTASRIVISLKAAVRRLGRALLGAWLMVGPFVGIYARDEEALVVVLILLAAAYGFVAGRCASEGLKCVAPILVDGAALLAVLWIASASRELLGAAAVPLRHDYVWAAPAVLLVCFWLVEILNARRHRARA